VFNVAGIGKADIGICVILTKINTRKVAQIEKNPNVAMMIASEGAPTRPYVAIKAIAKIHKESEIKKEVLGNSFGEIHKKSRGP